MLIDLLCCLCHVSFWKYVKTYKGLNRGGGLVWGEKMIYLKSQVVKKVIFYIQCFDVAAENNTFVLLSAAQNFLKEPHS